MCQTPECSPLYPLEFMKRRLGNCKMFSLSNGREVRIREKYLNEVLNINLKLECFEVDQRAFLLLAPLLFFFYSE